MRDTQHARINEGCHPALVDRELYYRVQDRIAGWRTTAPRKHSRRATRPWVLRGILLCEHLRQGDGHPHCAVRTGRPALLSMQIHSSVR
jgi:hypothetical protein